MASVPIPGPGSIVIAGNMREARRQGVSRNMATPSTYYWFYQKVRNGGPWDDKKFDPYFAAFGNFNFGLPAPPQVFLQTSFLWAQVGRRIVREPQNPNGGNGMKNLPMEMTLRISAISEKG